MISSNTISKAALGVTLALLILAVYTNPGWLWGVGHFNYFGEYAWHFLGVLVLLTLYLAYGPLPAAIIERAADRTSAIVWGQSFVPRILISLGFAAAFYFFRVGTAFLGDGYYLLNVFGRNEGYAIVWEKPISIWTIKLLQLIYGGYTYWTSLLAFQTMSIVSGFVVVYNFIVIAGLISDSAIGRLLSFVILIGSGWMLLFFGYIEYYPLLWLAASFFIRYALVFVKSRKSFWAVLFWFILAAGAHMQALYFLPGVLYLIVLKFAPRRLKKAPDRKIRTAAIVIFSLVLLGVVIIPLLVSASGNPFLSLLPLKAEFPNYAVLSVSNLLEVANLIFLCVPSVLILLALAFTTPNADTDNTTRLLTLFSFGSLAFLGTINPKLGLARDFDLMSLTLFAPVLLLLYRVAGKRPAPLRPWLFSSVLSVFVAFSYLAANCSQEKSITRAHDLLQYYETKSKRAWQSFAKFLEADGQTALVEHVKAEISSLFPEEVKFQTAVSLIANDKLAEAEFLLQELLRTQPENGEYLVALADIRAAQDDFRQVRLLLEKAIKTHPNHNNFLSLGQACLIERDFGAAIEALERAYKLAPGSQDIVTELCKACFFGGRPMRARELAGKLLAMNPKSADGNIITMIFLLQDGRKSEAARHYRQFLLYGQEHPDYETIKATYKDLAPRE